MDETSAFPKFAAVACLTLFNFIINVMLYGIGFGSREEWSFEEFGINIQK